MSDLPIVALDDVDTWPAQFRALVERAAAGADEDAWFVGDDEIKAVDALRGCRVRAYHCTRLTRREVDSMVELQDEINDALRAGMQPTFSPQS